MEAAKVDGASHYDIFLELLYLYQYQLLHQFLFFNFYGAGMIY